MFLQMILIKKMEQILNLNVLLQITTSMPLMELKQPGRPLGSMKVLLLLILLWINSKDKVGTKIYHEDLTAKVFALLLKWLTQI